MNFATYFRYGVSLILCVCMIALHVVERSYCESESRITWEEPTVITQTFDAELLKPLPCQHAQALDWVGCKYDFIHCTVMHSYMEMALGKFSAMVVAGFGIIFCLIPFSRRFGLPVLCSAILARLMMTVLDAWYYSTPL